jgi:aminoglycoside phosphotransferase (APT) family kinase protein
MRPGEELNAETLAQYLTGKVEGFDKPIRISQFPSGHSNLTYLIDAGSREYVLRRGPLGPVPPKAHDMAREYHVLEAVHPYFPEAPRAFHLCEDVSIIGGVFFLMERRHGLVLRSTVPPEISQIPNYPALASEAFLQCLVRLHAIDVAQTGLDAVGKPDGFLERQVEGWANRWRRAQIDEISGVEGLIQWLRDRRPISGPPALVHNDYKLDNVVFPLKGVGRIEAVLDWEMTTVGDPLADLGLTLCYWAWANTPELRGPVAPSITSEAGWYSRKQFINRYAELSGRDVTRISYYEVLGIFKLAVILQQIYFRFRRGQTADKRFEDFGSRVQALIKVAVRLVEDNA